MLMVELEHEVEDLLAGLTVQRTRWLIGPDERGSGREGAGNGKTLALASAHFSGTVPPPIEEALKRIRQAWPQIAVLILTNYNEDDLMIRGLQAGALGYLLKDTDLEQLLQSIRHAARGETLVQPEIMQRVLALAAQASSPQQSAKRQKNQDLTVRERDILARVAQGERSKEIAAHLGLTERTVGAYLTTIYTKLGVDSRASAVAVAIERGLLPRQRE